MSCSGNESIKYAGCGYDFYHVWPQVTKLDALPADGERSFDFVGRTESLAEDMDELLRRLRVTNTPRSVLQSAVHISSLTNDDPCHKLITVPAAAVDAALPVLCDLLEADFKCFGYNWPPCCAHFRPQWLATYLQSAAVRDAVPEDIQDSHRPWRSILDPPSSAPANSTDGQRSTCRSESSRCRPDGPICCHRRTASGAASSRGMAHNAHVGSPKNGQPWRGRQLTSAS